MERLTYKGTPYMTEDGMVTPAYSDYSIRRIIDRLAEYEDAEELCIEECGCCLRMVIEKYKEFLEDMVELAEYRHAEEQGLLLRLPYPINTKYIWWYDEEDCDIYRLDAEYLTVSWDVKRNEITYTIDTYDFVKSDFGTILFLTREEAEQALKQMGE